MKQINPPVSGKIIGGMYENPQVWQCRECGKKLKSRSVTVKHCGRYTDYLGDWQTYQVKKDQKQEKKEVPVSEVWSVYECEACHLRTNSTFGVFHCNKRMKWIRPAFGPVYDEVRKFKDEDIPSRPMRKEIEKEVMNQGKEVKIMVSGYITMKESDYQTVMAYEDPYHGLIMAMGMEYTNKENLEFETEN